MSNQLTQEHINHNTKLLVEASILGDIDTVKRLIPVSDPKAKESAALRIAAYNGHVDIVKLLIPVSDAKARDSQALLWAAKLRQTEIIETLIPVSDYLKVEQYMKLECLDTTSLRQYIDEHESLLQKERLTHELKSSKDNNHFSIKRKM